MLCAAALAGCGGSSSGGASPGVTNNQILFGQTTPQSGPAALYGQSTAGVNAYFDSINAAGGVQGHQLKLVALNDQYEPSVAIQQQRKLLNENKVFAEVAVNGSATTKAALNILDPAHVPVIGPQTGASFLFDTFRPNLYNVWPSYVTEGKLLGSFASNNQHLGKVGVLYQNDDFGKSLFAGVQQSGLKPAQAIAYDPNQTDFSPQAQQFKNAGVDGVIILAIPKATISFLNAMGDINYKPVRIMSQTSAIPETFFSASPTEFPDSYVGAFIPPLNNPSDPRVAEFRNAMAKYQPGAPVSVFSAWGWTEAQAAVAGLKAIKGPITREAYQNALNSVSNLQTLGGPLTYTPQDHKGIQNMFMVQAKNGQLVPAGP
jgi:branched-chain amino acid transport system substrate-binding protein